MICRTNDGRYFWNSVLRRKQPPIPKKKAKTIQRQKKRLRKNRNKQQNHRSPPHRHHSRKALKSWPPALTELQKLRNSMNMWPLHGSARSSVTSRSCRIFLLED